VSQEETSEVTLGKGEEQEEAKVDNLAINIRMSKIVRITRMKSKTKKIVIGDGVEA
jgi:hypothetical protein